MKPDGLVDNYYFGGGGDTLVTPLALVVFLVASMLMLVLPRKYLAIPFFVAGLLITVRQQVVIAGLHLMIYRLLILVGWVRILWKGIITKRESSLNRLNPLDKVFIAWACSDALMYTILWGESGALINRMGFLYTTLGTYFLLRYSLRDYEDVIRAIKTLVLICAVVGAFMLAEHSSGHNSFSIFGGVSEFSDVRNGKIRAQGPFLHSIVAGTFGAMLLPLFIALWLRKGSRAMGALGILASAAIAFASASSTPLMTYGAGVLGFCLWPFRTRMRSFRWGLVLLLIGLQACMKAPIWFLINRISALTGGTGWHRSELIDQFVRHFWEWWLIGTRNNASWGLDMWDSINAFVNAGVQGGLITFVLFLSVFVCGYKIIGRARRRARHDRKVERLIWACGVALFANTVAFFGITYFDQSVIGWYALLAIISMSGTLASANEQERVLCLPESCQFSPYEYVALSAVDSDPRDCVLQIEASDSTSEGK